ncbi:phosphopantetheine-binding protein [Streptomyces sp. NPDC058001]|uniref:phosphopantetheine-binding protein n=1 Tax=Streptomyces sp. NPDC058001 TaxID=3346300 RepID=UPI0036EC4F4D
MLPSCCCASPRGDRGVQREPLRCAPGVEIWGVIMWDGRFEILLRAQLPFLSREDELVDDLPLRDFGLDSLGMIQLLNVLESEYELWFGEEFLRTETFQTPSSLWEAISKMTSGRLM